MTKAMTHPIFARCYARLASAMEAAGGHSHREELLSGVSGRVIEIGAGSGLNFAHFPASVTEVIAVEPEPYLRERASRAALTTRMQIRLVDAVAEHLPFEGGEFDVAIASHVLCSVADPHRALEELHRVLRAGGELRFYEHVRSSDPRCARWQDPLNGPWSFVAGGCQTNRRTLDYIQQAGFEVADVRHFSFRPSILCMPISSFVIGRAVRQ